MDPLLSIALITGASGAGASVITRRMGLSRPWRRLFVLGCAVAPPLGFLALGGTAAVRSAVNALKGGKSRNAGKTAGRSNREKDILRKMTPREREVYLRQEGLKELKSNLAVSEARVDAARLRSAARKDFLMGRPGWDETNLHGDRIYRFLLSRQASAEVTFSRDRRVLQDYMLRTSVREKRDLQDLFSVRCNRLADGTLTFELPYDAGAEVLNEIRIALSRDWGVPLGDLSRASITEHRSNDFGTVGMSLPRPGMDKDRADSTVFVYDRRRGHIGPAGERLSPDSVNKVFSAMEEFRARAKSLAGDEHIILDREMLKGSLTLHTLGFDTVALAVNGVAVAYATAGHDGGIHMTGDDVTLGDTKSLRTASSLKERLGSCSNFGQWLDKAVEILLSPENIGQTAKAIERKKFKQRIMEVPKMAVNYTKKSLKMK